MKYREVTEKNYNFGVDSAKTAEHKGISNRQIQFKSLK
jgi:hypothetical protein